MNLSIKSVSVHQRLSHEANCFSATIYLEGKKIGEVCNRGFGGPHQYHWSNKEVGAQVMTWAESQPTEFNFDKLDQIIDELLIEYEYIRSLRKMTKKEVLFRLKGDKLGDWRSIDSPLTERARAFITDRYGDKVECIANDDLAKAVQFCKVPR